MAQQHSQATSGKPEATRKTTRKKKVSKRQQRPAKAGKDTTGSPVNTGKGGIAPPEHSRFQPGVSGNPNGRPLGARNRFAEKVIRSYERVWDMPPVETPEELKEVAKTLCFGDRALMRLGADPEKFVANAIKLVPDEMDIGDKAQSSFRGIMEALVTGKMPKLPSDTFEDDDNGK